MNRLRQVSDFQARQISTESLQEEPRMGLVGDARERYLRMRRSAQRVEAHAAVRRIVAASACERRSGR